MSQNIIIISVIGIFGLLLLFKNKEYNEDNEDKFYIAKSNIHGVGIYVNNNYKKDKEIMMVIDKNRNITELAKKLNHCNKPNTIIKEKNDGWYIYALQDIKKDTELTVNYNDTPDFIVKPNPSWKC
jgi:hypothetical protein